MTGKPRFPPNTTFVVRRVIRDEYGIDDIPDPQGQYWAAFATEAEAAAHARELDRADVLVNGAAGNPFRRGTDAATSLPEPALRDWLRKADIEPPAGLTPQSWGEWWRQVARADRTLTPDQFRHLLAALDRVPTERYEVVAVPAAEEPTGETAFAVVERSWSYDDSTFSGNNLPLVVYRTRAAAEAERDRRNADQEAGGDIIADWPHGFEVVELLLAPGV